MIHEEIYSGKNKDTEFKNKEDSFESVAENDVVGLTLGDEEGKNKAREAQEIDNQEAQVKMDEIREKLGLRTDKEQETELQQIRVDSDARLDKMQQNMDENNADGTLESVQRLLQDKLNVNKVADVEYTAELFLQDTAQMRSLSETHKDDQEVVDFIRKYEEDTVAAKRGVAYDAENVQNNSNESGDELQIDSSRKEYLDIVKKSGVEIDGNVEDMETYELEYAASMASWNLIKEGSEFTEGESRVLENAGEKFGTDIEDMFREILTAQPMNFEEHKGIEYNTDYFVDDTSRLGWLGMAIEIAQGKMESKLEYEKAKRMELGDENAQEIFEESMKKLQDSYDKVQNRFDSLPDEISEAYEASIRGELM